MSKLNIEKDISPSDFATYCYCGIKWLLEKTDKRDEYDYYNENLKEGRKNEKLCIDYILAKNKRKIIFDGTGNNRDLLETNLSIYNKKIFSKPDLILKNEKDNASSEYILFEFKAIKKREYLNYKTFDSVLAQIWCYSFLNYPPIDTYYLLRYFKNPLEEGNVRLEKITKKRLDNIDFNSLLKEYEKSIDLLRTKDDVDPRINYKDFNRPGNEKNIKKKCTNCCYNNDCGYYILKDSEMRLQKYSN